MWDAVVHFYPDKMMTINQTALCPAIKRGFQRNSYSPNIILSHSCKICDISPILTARPLKQQPRPPFRVKVKLEATDSLSASPQQTTICYFLVTAPGFIFSLRRDFANSELCEGHCTLRARSHSSLN